MYVNSGIYSAVFRDFTACPSKKFGLVALLVAAMLHPLAFNRIGRLGQCKTYIFVVAVSRYLSLAR